MHDGDDGWDADDDLSALDYSPEPEVESDEEHASALDAVDAHAGRDNLGDVGDPDDWGDALDVQVADEPPIPLIPATSPPGTVTVTAYVNGMVHRVELAHDAVTRTEAELAEEICVVANVAATKATSAMHIFGVELLAAHGIDRDTATTYITENMPFATPAQARAAEADLVARYADGG